MAEEKLADQSTAAPTPKLVAGTVSGAAVIVLLWVADVVGLDLPQAVAGSIVLLGAALAAYVKRNYIKDEPGEHAA